MKKHLLILLLPFLFVSCVSSKRIIYLSTMNLNKPDQVNLQEYEKKYGDYDAVFLDVNRSYEHTGTKVEYGSYFGSNDWNFSVVYNEKYLVLNPDNDKYTTFVYNVGSSANIGNFYLKVTSPEGKVTIYGLKDCKKETDSEGEITYKFIYPDIQKGSIIDEGIETTYNLYRTYIPLQHQIQLQFSVPCEHIVFNYAYPDWWKIQRKKISEDDNLNILTKNDPDNNKTTLSYIGNNIPAVDDELYSPFYKEMAN